jgi:hypothetical protein
MNVTNSTLRALAAQNAKNLQDFNDFADSDLGNDSARVVGALAELARQNSETLADLIVWVDRNSVESLGRGAGF